MNLFYNEGPVPTSIFQSESEPEIDIYFQRGMSLKVGFVSSAR